MNRRQRLEYLKKHGWYKALYPKGWRKSVWIKAETRFEHYDYHAMTEKEAAKVQRSM